MADTSRHTPDQRGTSGLESLVKQPPLRKLLDERVNIEEFGGGLPEEWARVPSVRLGHCWFSSLWLIPLAIAGLVIAIALA